MGRLSIALTLGQTAAQIAVSFAPVPGLAPAVDLVCKIIELCAEITSNKHAARQLSERCERLLLALDGKSSAGCMYSDNIASAIFGVQETLLDVQETMNAWAHTERLVAFVKAKEIEGDIARCHNAISDCLIKFHLDAQRDFLEWRAEFDSSRELDHQQVIKYLAEIQNEQSITNGILQKHSEILNGMMEVMQNALCDFRGEASHHGLQNNLYQLQFKSKTLLPDFNLKRGEVRRQGISPVSGTTIMDIWEGIYLDTEKVAVKVIRSVHANPNTLKRFKREVRIWETIWKVDQGQYILPFYGFCQNDGPFPYMVSPWQSNGTALAYAMKTQVWIIDICLLVQVRGIAEGVRVLHTMDPPIVHGDIKASNVMINSWGEPLLADFGVSKIVEDITDVPFTQSQGINDSYRWFAPELFDEMGHLSTGSDIYAFGMTILEVMTHNHPFAEIKRTARVVISVADGKRPSRPAAPDVIARGLDDHLWDLLQKCWQPNPLDRPNIGEALTEILQSK